MSNNISTRVIIPCRFSYLHCWEPDSVNGGDPKYSVSAIIQKNDAKTVNAIRKAIERAKQESLSKWGGKIPGGERMNPLRDGDEVHPDKPEFEADAAKNILRAVGVEGQCGMDIVSCPTCSRTKIDLIPLVKRFEEAVDKAGLASVPVKVALMGCPVNGPGEAREADVGIAGGRGEAVLFRRGEIIEKIPEEQVIDRLLHEIRLLRKEMNA